MPGEFDSLFQRVLPETVGRLLVPPFGEVVPRTAKGERLAVAATGRFTGRQAADLLADDRHREGVLILIDGDVVRILGIVGRHVVCADSNVLFERLGRILGKAAVLTTEAANRIIEIEEQEGLAAAAACLPLPAAQWGLNRRVHEIAIGLYFMSHAYYVWIEGHPTLSTLPVVDVPSVELAMEGLRVYDEWRNRSECGAIA
ncbi:MAG: hypothetical protein ACYTG6_01870, partial [Planctomycetota bacterium]